MMIDPIWLGGTAALAGASVIGWLMGRGRGRHEGEERGAKESAALGARRDAAERALRDAQAENQKWRAMSLAASGLSREPVFLARTAPADAEELASLARGLVFVDDVVIADASGLALTREADGGSAMLAALGGAAASMLARGAALGVPVVQVAIETFTAEHYCIRPLLGRAENTFFVARTTSQPMNPLAIDAVVHAAARDAIELAPTSPVLALRGATETKLTAESWRAVADELESEVHGDVRGLLVTSDGRPAVAVVKDGPAPGVSGGLTWELSAFARRASVLLRRTPVARVEAVLRDRTRIGWSSLGPTSSFALVAIGRTDARLLARLSGRVLRAMSTRERSAA